MKTKAEQGQFDSCNINLTVKAAEIERKQKADEKFKAWLEAKNQQEKSAREKRERQRLKERQKSEVKKQISEAKFKEWLV